MLKRKADCSFYCNCLITVQDNTMLKLALPPSENAASLITVQDNTMLKLTILCNSGIYGLITVQDNTMLKHIKEEAK